MNNTNIYPEWETEDIIPQFPFKSKLILMINPEHIFSLYDLNKDVENEFNEWRCVVDKFNLEFKKRAICEAIDSLNYVINITRSDYRDVFCKYLDIVRGMSSQNNTGDEGYRMKTKLTYLQICQLFDLLAVNNFISNNNKEGFIWLFGEGKRPSELIKIDWIDMSTTRKEPNTKTLFELLFLLGVDDDTSANNPYNLYRRMEFCFKNLRNLGQKNPYRVQQDTGRKITLKSIVDGLM